MLDSILKKEDIKIRSITKKTDNDILNNNVKKKYVGDINILDSKAKELIYNIKIIDNKITNNSPINAFRQKINELETIYVKQNQNLYSKGTLVSLLYSYFLYKFNEYENNINDYFKHYKKNSIINILKFKSKNRKKLNNNIDSVCDEISKFNIYSNDDNKKIKIQRV